MKKLLIALAVIGVCFGATSVRAESPYDCNMLKTYIWQSLQYHDLIRSTDSKGESVSSQKKILDKARAKAAEWATIYNVLCKQ